jgi:4-hydroxybenzoate polyprenyltransferase
MPSTRVPPPIAAGDVAPPAARILAYVGTVRLPETAVVFLGTLVGARLSGLRDISPWLFYGLAGSNALLFAASMALNDWHDLPEDRINKPSRPLAAGRALPEQVVRLAAVLFLAGIGVAAALAPRLGIAAAMITGISLGYSLRLKAVPLAGNAVVAVTSAYPVWGWVLVGATGDSAFYALSGSLILFRLGAEVVKAAEDAVGDAAAGIRTLATIRGPLAAVRVGCVLMGVAALIAWWPATAGRATWTYILPMTAATGLLAGGSVLSLRVTADPAALARRLVRLERIAMGLGVIAFGLGLR